MIMLLKTSDLKLVLEMKLTTVGDPHLKPDNLDKAEKLFSIVEELGHTTMWLGDLLDTKEIVRSKCLNLLYRSFKKSRLQHVILVGNHDYHSLSCEDHSLAVLKELPNVDVIDSTSRFTLASGGVALIPFHSDLTKFRNELKTVKDSRLLIMHQGVNGFDYGNGYIADNEISIDELNSFELVISGHFHKYQKKSNLVYLGTPFSHSFGESDQEKFIGVLDTNTLSLDLTPTQFPKHRTLHLTVPVEDMSKVDHTLKNSCDKWRVILEGKQEDISKFDKSEFPTIKFIEKPTSDFITGSLISEAESHELKFAKWAKDIKQLDKKTTNLGLEILREQMQ